MRTINNQRARLIHYELKSDSCADVSTAMEMLLQNCPSYTENINCRNKGCISKQKQAIFPVVKLDKDVFGNDWNNLEAAMKQNFTSDATCPKCRKGSDDFIRKFGEHLIIEVIFSPFINYY